MAGRKRSSKGRLRRLVRKCLFAAIATVLFLAALEIGTRLFWDYEVPKPTAGIVLAGNGRRVVHEGVLYRTNSERIRCREIRNEPKKGVRILAVGDSFLWGTGIPEEALVTTRLEQKLRGRLPGVTVINAGLPGHNTSDQFAQLTRLAPIYKPDHVMVFFFTNDVLALRPTEPTGRRETSLRQRVKEWLRQNSKFCALIYYQYKTRWAAEFGVPRSLLPPDYFDLDDSKDGWVAFKKALRDIRDYCRATGMSLQFVVIPTLTCLNENYPYTELREKVAAYAAELDVATVDLFAVYSPYSPASLWVHPENTHWNDQATTLAAEAVTRQFLEKGFCTSGPATKPSKSQP